MSSGRNDKRRMEHQMAVSSPAPGRARFVHDMDVVESMHRALKAAGIDFAAYLPETILYPVMQAVEDDPEITSISVAREDEGVAMCAGAFLGGMWPVLLTEASGLGLSGLMLARAVVQRTPMLILAGHNEALGERHDYTAATRRTSEPLMRALNIPYVVARNGQEIPQLITEAQLTVRGDRRPVALFFPRHTLHAAEEDA